jgi:hypothetical protein
MKSNGGSNGWVNADKGHTDENSIPPDLMGSLQIMGVKLQPTFTLATISIILRMCVKTCCAQQTGSGDSCQTDTPF